MFFLDTNKEELEMSKELEYKIKVLLAWKELEIGRASCRERV